MKQWLIKNFPSIAIGVVAVIAWEILVSLRGIDPKILPGPHLIVDTVYWDAALLLPSLAATLAVTITALVAAILTGGVLGVLISRANWLERGLHPYVILGQAIPLVAAAPLIISWADNVFVAMVLCAWSVAFLPMLCATIMGLKSADRDLQDFFRLSGATKWQVRTKLKVPSAVPCLLLGMRQAGIMALLGTVVAEFAGGNAAGLAYRILEAGYNLQMAQLLAGMLLLSASAIAIYGAFSLLARRASKKGYRL
jgi:NitT/TauT family transport system permease protein